MYFHLVVSYFTYTPTIYKDFLPQKSLDEKYQNVNNFASCKLFYFRENVIKVYTVHPIGVGLSRHDSVCNWALE